MHMKTFYIVLLCVKDSWRSIQFVCIWMYLAERPWCNRIF